MSAPKKAVRARVMGLRVRYRVTFKAKKGDRWKAPYYFNTAKFARAFARYWHKELGLYGWSVDCTHCSIPKARQ